MLSFLFPPEGVVPQYLVLAVGALKGALDEGAVGQALAGLAEMERSSSTSAYQYGYQSAPSHYQAQVAQELGLEIAERNARGVTFKRPTTGGEQERQIRIRNRYLAQARNAQLKWPRTARMLRRIAQAYASEAHMNDRNAELRENGW